MGPDGKKECVRTMRRRYQESGREQKTLILDELCAICGYQQEYAIRLLGQRSKRPQLKRGPNRVYGQEVFQVIKAILPLTGLSRMEGGLP